MQELDKPAATVETAPVIADECGGPMGPAEPPMSQPDTPPPSMSINLNAQGLDNIEELMALIKAVNPDADKPALPSMSIEPSITSIKPALPPLKMLPDFDSDNDNMPGGEKDSMNGDDGVTKAQGDLDNDGDHDMDDHDIEKKEDGGFQSATTEPDPEFKNADYMLNKLAGGMNRPKDTFPKVSDGDNPMKKVREGDDFKEQIKSDLRRRLEESKKKTLDEGPMDFVKKAGAAVKGWATGGLAGAKTAMAKQAAGATPAKPAKNSFGKVAKAPAAGGPGVSPAQAAQQSSAVDITPEMGNALSAKLKQMADDVADGAYPNIKNVKAMIDSYLDNISKQAARTDLGAK